MNKLLKKILLITAILVSFKILTIIIGLDTLNTSFISQITANTTCGLQNIFGIDCYVNNNIIFYDSFILIITFFCSGIDQLVYLGAMLFGFFGFENKRTNKQIISILLVIYIINYLRLFFFYHFVKELGFVSAKSGHNFFYLYGQGIFLLVIFILFVIYKIYEDKKTLKKSNNMQTNINEKNKNQKLFKKNKNKLLSSKVKKHRENKN